MTAPMRHPAWCDRQHAAEWPVHTAQVGADIELTEDLSYAVLLFQRAGQPAEVQLLRHTPDETAVTGLSIVEAGIFRDLLGEALGLIAREAGLR